MKSNQDPGNDQDEQARVISAFGTLHCMDPIVESNCDDPKTRVSLSLVRFRCNNMTFIFHGP